MSIEEPQPQPLPETGVAGGAGQTFGVDNRPVVKSEHAPPPVTGGTLLALTDARRALISDPDRDRIWLVDYLHNQFEGPIALEAGALPSRAVEDKAGHAYVVLRGSGDVLTINLNDASAGERRHVCNTPRGIALAPSGDRLLVACAEGRLVELGLTGPVLSESRIEMDARDVVVQRDRVFVSRFRSSELLQLDSARAVATRMRLPSVTGTLGGSGKRLDPLTENAGLFEAAVAWRTVVGPNNNSIVMVHQRATANDIALPPHIDATQPSTDGPNAGVSTAPGGGSPYGGDFSGCGGIVQSALTVVQDGVAVTSPQLGGVVLPVDIAVSNDGFIAIANAGSADQSGGNGAFSASAGNSLVVFTATSIDRTLNGDCVSLPRSTFEQPMVAVAFEPGPSGRVLALGRQPLALYVVDGFRNGGAPGLTTRVDIATESRLDTGHEIFHRDAGGGIACASCHPEGTDDGRTWNFAPIGARRTQAIDVGLADTAPFHWDGDLPTLDSLMSEVFVRRMGGARESSERVAAVQDWIFGLTPRAALRAPDDAAALRGAELFNSSEVGCASCHAGPKFTNNLSVDVGTGGKFQVPSLLGVGQRVPVMHNGCATTLRARFDASCGGSAHGNTRHLDESQLGDLVSYLESL
ncbi:MAG: cytochrome-c peroxidase [Myxococcota bacterium]